MPTHRFNTLFRTSWFLRVDQDGQHQTSCLKGESCGLTAARYAVLRAALGAVQYDPARMELRFRIPRAALLYQLARRSNAPARRCLWHRPRCRWHALPQPWRSVAPVGRRCQGADCVAAEHFCVQPKTTRWHAAISTGGLKIGRSAQHHKRPFFFFSSSSFFFSPSRLLEPNLTGFSTAPFDSREYLLRGSFLALAS